jgi:hypothetical protein
MKNTSRKSKTNKSPITKCSPSPEQLATQLILGGPYAVENLLSTRLNSASVTNTKDELLAYVMASRYFLDQYVKMREEWGPLIDALGTLVDKRADQRISDSGALT